MKSINLFPLRLLTLIGDALAFVKEGSFPTLLRVVPHTSRSRCLALKALATGEQRCYDCDSGKGSRYYKGIADTLIVDQPCLELYIGWELSKSLHRVSYRFNNLNQVSLGLYTFDTVAEV